MIQMTPNGEMITLIHMVYQVAGEWRIVCMPNMTEFHTTPYHPAYMRANDMRAVTCPQCMANYSDTYKRPL